VTHGEKLPGSQLDVLRDEDEQPDAKATAHHHPATKIPQRAPDRRALGNSELERESTVDAMPVSCHSARELRSRRSHPPGSERSHPVACAATSGSASCRIACEKPGRSRKLPSFGGWHGAWIRAAARLFVRCLLFSAPHHSARGGIPSMPLHSTPRGARHGAGLAIATLIASAFAACAEDAGNTVGGSSGGSAGNGGSAGSATGGTGNITLPDGSGAQGDGSVPVDLRPDLPPPWQYYSEGTDHGYKDPSLPADVRDKFNGTKDGSLVPTVVYPLPGSLHPMNLTLISFHWNKAVKANTLFRIDAQAGGETFRMFVSCTTPGCAVAIPESEWFDLGKRFHGAEVAFTISETDGLGGPVYTSAEFKLNYSPDPVFGALYYWAAAEHGIKRASFGSVQAVPFITPRSATNDYACAACHSVSRDGKVIAFAVSEYEGEGTAAIQTAPTQDPTQPYVRPPKGQTPFPAPDIRPPNVTEGPTDFFGHAVALSPDGSLAAVNGIPTTPPSYWPAFLEIRDTKTGASLNRYDAGNGIFGGAEKLGIHPEWSPDGQSLVVALADGGPAACQWTYSTCSSSIAVIPVTGNGLGQARIVVQGTGDYYHYYPSWSPDGKWIAFVSARPNSGPNQTSLSNPTGVLRLVSSQGGPYTCPGSGCIELGNATQYTPAAADAGQGLHSTLPKFTPFAQGPGGQLMFISYTSNIDYGLLAKGKTQIWMSAIDTSRIAAGQDPSFPPIWLPYQSFTDGSLAPYWAETLPCEADPNGGCTGCVGGERCIVDRENNCQCAAIPVR
jgi:hypothetical protein